MHNLNFDRSKHQTATFYFFAAEFRFDFVRNPKPLAILVTATIDLFLLTAVSFISHLSFCQEEVFVYQDGENYRQNQAMAAR